MKNAFLCAAVVILSCGLALGQATEKVLWTFTGVSDGWERKSKLLFDNQGNLYGTTEGGGSSNQNCGEGGGCGTVYELSPLPGGAWTKNILYRFCAPQNSLCPDGSYPEGGLVLDESGNLYGTTVQGGTFGEGTVFELSPPPLSGGAWTESVLYSFCANKIGSQCLDGQFPESDLVFDQDGNLYGTTVDGGTGHLDDSGYLGGGTVFEVSPGVNGWTQVVLYSFCSLGQGNRCPDGVYPSQGVTFKNGNLYGATAYGGSSNKGTVYELSHSPNGWTETVIYEVRSKSGGDDPEGTVSFDPAGNLYGTLYSFGGPGAVFRLGINGTYREVAPANGTLPQSGVLVDAKRRALYGTTLGGGNDFYLGTGVVFEVSASGQATTLYEFCSQLNCADGSEAGSALAEDALGNLYGTTVLGGSQACVDGGCGVVFEVTP